VRRILPRAAPRRSSVQNLWWDAARLSDSVWSSVQNLRLDPARLGDSVWSSVQNLRLDPA